MGGKDVFGNIISTTDGMGFTYGNASGIIYTFLPSLDATFQDLVHNNEVSVHFAEKALPANSCGGAVDNGACGRVTVNGLMTPVPPEHAQLALQYIETRDPAAKLWAMTHGFVPHWSAAENITKITWEGANGETSEIKIDDYLSAPFQRQTLMASGETHTELSELSNLGYNPRPHFWQGEDLARWLVHESEFVAIGLHDGDSVMGASV